MKSQIRTLLLGGLLAVWLVLTSCSPSPQQQAPLASGQIIHVLLNDKPVNKPGEMGTSRARAFNDGRVDIYERVIVITELDGTKHCAPPEWFSEVTFK